MACVDFVIEQYHGLFLSKNCASPHSCLIYTLCLICEAACVLFCISVHLIFHLIYQDISFKAIAEITFCYYLINNYCRISQYSDFQSKLARYLLIILFSSSNKSLIVRIDRSKTK